MATPEKVELRGLAPVDLAKALDAIAMAKGLDRNTYVVHVLEAEVKRVVGEASVISRVMRGNAYMTDPNGGHVE